MATIKAFQGVRYDTMQAGSLEDLITPPYDVIGRQAEAAYLSRNGYSMIRLDITKEPGGAKNTDSERYARPARLLEQWLEERILVRDPRPALYPYDVEYRLQDGTTLVRKGFVALVKLAEFEEGIVKPHEQTFASVAGDRLELARACRAQFSQVFSCYSDPGNLIIRILDDKRGAEIGATTDGDGCRHTLWRIEDPATIEEVCKIFVDKSVYIADGHHRYKTALSYRNETVSDRDPGTERDEQYIMMYLCPMEDEGLSILAPHRLLRYPGALGIEELLGRLGRYFEIDEVLGGTREVLVGELLALMKESRLLEPRTSVFGCYHAGQDRGFLLTLRPGGREEMAEGPSCLRELDVVMLSELIIDKALGLSAAAIESDNLLTYHSDAHEGLDISVKLSAANGAVVPLLFLINPPTMAQVQTVSDQGLIMPHKSTYFYPKVVTGLVMNVFHERQRQPSDSA